MHAPRLLIFVLSALVSLPVTVDAGSLPDTGQITCHTVYYVEACDEISAGDAATNPRQDGRYGRDVAAAAGVVTKIGGGDAGFDYSKVSNNGSILGADAVLGVGDGGWACTRDNITGLMWEVKVSDPAHLRYMDMYYTWYSGDDATNGGHPGFADGGVSSGSDECYDGARCDTEKFVSDVNASLLCGFGDWRLPSKRELQTITHFGLNTSPAIDPAYFPNTRDFIEYWTSTSSAFDASYAYGVGFINGRDGMEPKYYTKHVRLVRGAKF